MQRISRTKMNEILLGAKDIVLSEAPYKEGRPLKHLPSRSTGNLKYNALKLEQLETNKWRIFVDELVAHYMPYTEEPWISPKWRGAKNPNEKWFYNATTMVFEYIATEMANIFGQQAIRTNAPPNVAGMDDEDDD